MNGPSPITSLDLKYPSTIPLSATDVALLLANVSPLLRDQCLADSLGITNSAQWEALVFAEEHLVREFLTERADRKSVV